LYHKHPKIVKQLKTQLDGFKASGCCRGSTGFAAAAGDLVGFEGNAAVDGVDVEGGEGEFVLMLLEDAEEVSGEAAEMGLLDTATGVDVPHGTTGVEQRATKGLAEEFLLHDAEFGCFGVGEEGTQLRVDEDSGIEDINQFLDAFLSADAVVEGSVFLGHGKGTLAGGGP